MKHLLIIFHLLAAFLLCCSAKAEITVDSVRTTISTCSSNGSMTIYAKTSVGTLSYSIVYGPVTRALQASNTFTSLPAGDYTIEISTSRVDLLTTVITIAGNYQSPDFTPILIPPGCPGSSNGSIIGNLLPTTGASPFTWELIAPSPILRSAQASDTFYNLPSGNYTIRLTDSCGNVQIKTAALAEPDVSIKFGGGYATITGCDTTAIALKVVTPAYRAPYSISYSVGGIRHFIDTAITDDPSLFNNGLYLYFTVPNLSYSGVIDSVIITNACGVSGYIPQLNICSFQLINTNITPVALPHCKNGVLTTFQLNDAGCNINVYPRFPLNVTIRDGLTNNIVEVKTYHSRFEYPLTSTAMEPGKSYTVTLSDSCNYSSSITVNTPSTNRYVTVDTNMQQTMLDSTVVVTLSAIGFPTQGITVSITGGPPSAHSTKAGYAYHENYIYPKKFSGQLQADSSTIFTIANTAPGIYTYVITDSCGNQFPGSFEITRNMVDNFHHYYHAQKTCEGLSRLQYEIEQHSTLQVNVTDINSQTNIHTMFGWQMQQNPFTGLVENITATDYEFSILYTGSGRDQSMNNMLVDSFTVKDTIHTTAYQAPSIAGTAFASCNGQLMLAISVDSTKGVPPYLYEITNGPQTFPLQSNNLFQLTSTGVYSVRIQDSCGKFVSTDVIVNPLVFPPMGVLGSTCLNNSVQLTYGAAAYVTYNWTKPNGSSFAGDTLLINPVTLADTGIYSIKKTTAINGCSSTQSTTYRLSIEKRDSTAVALCLGQTYLFGNNLLSSPGVYRDTIKTNSCDSISIVTINVHEPPTIQVASDQYLVNPGEKVQLSVSPSNLSSYWWTSFNTLHPADVYNPSSTVYSSSWYKVTVTDSNHCSQTDSIFIALKPDSIISCDKLLTIYIPNAFTPNNDGKNDRFRIPGVEGSLFKNYRLKIYNRWGILVFEADNSKAAWDGSYQSKPADTGNYFYLLQFTCSDGQKIFTKRGTVMLLR